MTSILRDILLIFQLRLNHENVAEYKGNRLVVFDAWRWHSAQAVRRECYELRAIIVFKTYANRERLNFYKNVK